MDLSKQIARVKAILGTPRTEWPVIASEAATIGGIYKDYVLILGRYPAVFGFLLKYSVIGINLPFLGTYRPRRRRGTQRDGHELRARPCAFVYVLSLIVDALAPTFGGQKNSVQAFKAVVYASTASCIAGPVREVLLMVLMLISLVGGVYSIYLLYLGLPQTMKCPAEKAAGYTAVTFVIAIVLSWLISFAVGGVIGVGSMPGSGLPGVSDSGDAGGFDEGSPMGANWSPWRGRRRRRARRWKPRRSPATCRPSVTPQGK